MSKQTPILPIAPGPVRILQMPKPWPYIHQTHPIEPAVCPICEHEQGKRK